MEITPAQRAVGEAVRQARVAAGLTQVQMGSRLTPPWSSATASAAEVGRRAWPIDDIVAVADVLGVTVQDLVATVPSRGAVLF